MRVIVTGASGKLGRACVHELYAAGWEVRGTDRRPTADAATPVEVVDLLDAPAVMAVVKGADAVVHLGNHPGPQYRIEAQTFSENVAMNMNVFQAALESGARKVVFASSIQVAASQPAEDQPSPPPVPVAYLPLDGDSPPQPTNAYALSKWVGEVMLRDYVARTGIECVALRYPMLRTGVQLRQWGADEPWARVPPTYWAAQGYSFLSYADGARLIRAVLAVSLPGYRAYLPGRCIVPAARVAEVLKAGYDGVPLKQPVEQMTSLIDISRITRETGWMPHDHVAGSQERSVCQPSVTSA